MRGGVPAQVKEPWSVLGTPFGPGFTLKSFVASRASATKRISAAIPCAGFKWVRFRSYIKYDIVQLKYLRSVIKKKSKYMSKCAAGFGHSV
ncbi:MAG: hypothetical protein K0R26_2490 [Bacteroidota bacterium]|jgi:hypothetical protein|nr:hypothetical protein [Bacteroidota bacterium]